MAQRFANFASRAASLAGHYLVFVVALGVVLVWALTGPLFGFSDTWQLVINTGTTIVTFLMVFLIQNTQNRDATALHLKLDEVIHAIKRADDRMIGAEEATEEELAALKEHYQALVGQHSGLGHNPRAEVEHSAAGHKGQSARAEPT
jgi:low affinity Fe/Cu permease